MRPTSAATSSMEALKKRHRREVNPMKRVPPKPRESKKRLQAELSSDDTDCASTSYPLRRPGPRDMEGMNQNILVESFNAQPTLAGAIAICNVPPATEVSVRSDPVFFPDGTRNCPRKKRHVTEGLWSVFPARQARHREEQARHHEDSSRRWRPHMTASTSRELLVYGDPLAAHFKSAPARLTRGYDDAPIDDYPTHLNYDDAPDDDAPTPEAAYPTHLDYGDPIEHTHRRGHGDTEMPQCDEAPEIYEDASVSFAINRMIVDTLAEVPDPAIIQGIVPRINNDTGVEPVIDITNGQSGIAPTIGNAAGTESAGSQSPMRRQGGRNKAARGAVPSPKKILAKIRTLFSNTKDSSPGGIDLPEANSPIEAVESRPVFSGEDPIEESLPSTNFAKAYVGECPPSPPSPPPGPLVAPLTKSEADNLDKVARDGLTQDRVAREEGRPRSSVVVALPKVRLTTHDFGTLVPQKFAGPVRGWLNDNIVDQYLEIITEQAKEKAGYVTSKTNHAAPPVHAVKSQWFTSMQNNPAMTARWARPAKLWGRKLLDCSLVLLPVCDGAHWRLVAIKPKERLIECYDSLLGDTDRYTEAARLWVQCVLEGGEEKGLYEDAQWTVSASQKSKKQANARDCGVFTVLNALVLLRGEEHTRVEVVDGMDDARFRIAATLLNRRSTGELV